MYVLSKNKENIEFFHLFLQPLKITAYYIGMFARNGDFAG